MSVDLLLIFVIFLPFLGSFFVLLSKDGEKQTFENAVHSAAFTVFVNILLILSLFSFMPLTPALDEIGYSIRFLPFMKFSFGADMITLLFMLGCQMAVFAGVFGIKYENQNQRHILFYALLYLSFLNGYFLALDIMSFFIFFMLQLFPLYMLIGWCLPENRHTLLVRLFVHYFLGAMLLLAASIFILSLKQDDILLFNIDKMHLSYRKSIMVWGGIFFALILRVPVWPFHYVLSSVCAVLKNPLAFIALSIMPLTGIYGFMRCWPLNIPFEISVLSPVFQALCVVTMVFAAFSAYVNFGGGRKLLNYVFIYDLLYLLAVFLPTDTIGLNIAYSVFSFLLITACLVVIEVFILRESIKANVNVRGMLCKMPRASLCYSLFVLAAAQLPVSAFFGNNFVIVSNIFNYHLYMGIAIVCSMTIGALCLFRGVYILRDESCALLEKDQIKDLDMGTFMLMMLFMAVLFLSLVNPLWFAVLKGI